MAWSRSISARRGGADAFVAPVAGGCGCGGALFGDTYITAPVLADCSVTATFAPLP